MAEPVTPVNGEKLQTAGFWHLFAGIIMVILGFYVWFNPVASLLGLALYIGIAFIVVGARLFSGFLFLSVRLVPAGGVVGYSGRGHFGSQPGGYRGHAADDLCLVVSGGRCHSTGDLFPAEKDRSALGLESRHRYFGYSVCLYDSDFSEHRRRYHYHADGDVHHFVRRFCHCRICLCAAGKLFAAFAIVGKIPKSGV